MSPTRPSTAGSAATAGLQRFAKLTGSQRPVGMIFPGDAMRQVFLGTLVLGDESRAMQYGRDRDRDLAGFVERIGDGALAAGDAATRISNRSST